MKTFNFYFFFLYTTICFYTKMSTVLVYLGFRKTCNNKWSAFLYRNFHKVEMELCCAFYAICSVVVWTIFFNWFEPVMKLVFTVFSDWHKNNTQTRYCYNENTSVTIETINLTSTNKTELTEEKFHQINKIRTKNYT